jgi:hypothetical protein
MLKIKWTDKIRNEEVLRRIDEERTLWNTIDERRTRWIGHTLRHNGFVKNIVKRKIGRKSAEEGHGTNKEKSTSQEIPGCKPPSIR